MLGIGHWWKGLDSTLVEAATRFLRSNDPQDRFAGLHVILRLPEAFPTETVAGAEETLAADLAAAPEDMRKTLEGIKADWDTRRRTREREERIRAILLP